MRAVPLLLMAVFATAPASAQSWGWYAGSAVTWMDGDLSDEPMAGVDIGMSFQGYFDKRPGFRVDARYAQRRVNDDERLHSLQVPLLYRLEFDDIHYALLGPAIGFSYHYEWFVIDLGAMAGLGVDIFRRETRIIGLEVAYNVGLPYVLAGLEVASAGSLQGLSLRVAVRGR